MDWIVWIIYSYSFFFISCLSLILEVPIHCRESIGEKVMWKQVKSVIMKNQLIYIVDNLRMSTFSVNVHFWVNYSFKEVSRSTSFALFDALFVQIQVTLY